MVGKFLQDVRDYVFSGKIVFNNLRQSSSATPVGVDANGFLVKTSGGSGDVVTSVNGETGDVTLDASSIGAATIEQGELADTAVQPGDLPTFGTAAEADSDDFATAAQGALAESAVQPGDLPAAPTWTTISGKPAVVAEGATQAAARTSIGAGTSNLEIGTTATTAKAGNYQPTWAQVTGKPSTFAPTIGTSGTTAMAGNTPVVKSEQEGGVGTIITNHIALTQAEYDGLATKNPSTVYEIIA